MLFQSIEFIYIFFPILIFIYLFLRIKNLYTESKIWIVVASLVFYTWWYPPNLMLILVSMGLNYALGMAVASPLNRPQNHLSQKIFLSLGVVLNLAALAYYKYWFFI